MNTKTLEFIKKEIEKVEAHGHGEVVVKIKNGYLWRLLSTRDILVDLTKEKNSVYDIK